MPNSKLRF
jgi:hypothetical protein